jgi:hypothetical protein
VFSRWFVTAFLLGATPLIRAGIRDHRLAGTGEKLPNLALQL